MARKSVSWASFGITPWRKREIMAFCRQYGEWKEALQYGLRAVSTEGSTHGNAISRPTENQAIRNADLRDNIQLVEDAIRDVCPQIFEEMLDNIAYGTRFADLRIPYSQADFYAIRIKVYALISKRQKGEHF